MAKGQVSASSWVKRGLKDRKRTVMHTLNIHRTCSFEGSQAAFLPRGQGSQGHMERAIWRVADQLTLASAVSVEVKTERKEWVLLSWVPVGMVGCSDPHIKKEGGWWHDEQNLGIALESVLVIADLTAT